MKANGKSWRNRLEVWGGRRKFIRKLENLGVDFSGAAKAPDMENWFRSTLEQISWATDTHYSSDLLRTQAQINALYNQINPHFLYNTLEMIRGQALIRDAEEIADMAETLSVMFRYNISNPEELATLEQEIGNVRNYFKIQQYRFGSRFRLAEDFDHNDPELMNCRIPRLSLQPLVENAISHGLEPKLGGGTVRITAFLTDSRVVVRVADDGIGMSVEQADKIREALRQGTRYQMDPGARHGIAIVNINKRLKLYYGEEYGLSLSSVEGEGTIMEMTAPLSESCIFDMRSRRD